MAQHAKPMHLHTLGKATRMDTAASAYADKDVEVTVWQGSWGHSTNHTWAELQSLHSQLGALLREAGQEVQEVQPEEYEYALQLREGPTLPWIDWDTNNGQVWGSKGRIENYLSLWVGKASWHHLQYRVYRRTKPGRTETIAEGTGHDTAPATF